MNLINDALNKAAKEREKAADFEEAVVTSVPTHSPAPIPLREKNRLWPFITLSLAVILIGALPFWFYSSWQVEKELRTKRDSELSRKTEELTQKEEELSQLEQQKKELEEQFYANVAALEKTTKDYDEKIKNLSEQIESLKNENDSLENVNNSLAGENKALKIENTAKDGNIAELFQKLHPNSPAAQKAAPLEQ